MCGREIVSERPQAVLLGTYADNFLSQVQPTMFVFLVDCHLTVNRGEVPLDVLKKSAEQIIVNAGNVAGSAFKLGKLDESGPYITPTDLPRAWNELREYIWINGDMLRFVTQFDMRGRRQGHFLATIGLAGIDPLDDKDIHDIGFHLKVRGIDHVVPRPASRGGGGQIG